MPQTKTIPFASTQSLVGSNFEFDVFFEYGTTLLFQVDITSNFRVIFGLGSSKCLIDTADFVAPQNIETSVNELIELSNYQDLLAIGFSEITDVTRFEIFSIDGQINTNLNAFEKLESVTTFRFSGETGNESEFSGSFESLPSSIVDLLIDRVEFTNEMDFSHFGSNMIYILMNNVTFSGGISYTVGKEWPGELNLVQINTHNGTGLETEQVDNILIDMADSVVAAVGAGIIEFQGDNQARSVASDAAVSYLQGLGFTVNTN